ncbi:MAG: hypothetical protein KME32_07120 [Mojavia pulchra JT2-VF2]|uniref:Allene oxide cyclase barrel-like domain-containing protein n=1 Tax=Mojavia pulchra JT2-VF2 TaxID=287848 RepID=A0A951PW50_9NOST|nr:hypothetical protein [Mojavia pulchra JT2-VF2]
MKYTDGGEPGRGVGDVINVTSNLFLEGTNTLIGTKQSEFTAIRQLGNGEIIAEGKEIIHLPDGDIYTLGQFSQTANEAGATNRLKIVGGTEAYSKANGFEYFTQAGNAGTGLYNTSLVIL